MTARDADYTFGIVAYGITQCHIGGGVTCVQGNHGVRLYFIKRLQVFTNKLHVFVTESFRDAFTFFNDVLFYVNACKVRSYMQFFPKIMV